MICYELQQRLAEENIKSVYCIYNLTYGFMKTLLLHAAEQLEGKTGKLVEKIIRGLAISKQEVIGSEFEGNLFQIIKAKVTASKSENVTIDIQDAFLWLKDVLEPYQDKPIVFIVEDMDKVERPESINDIVLMVRQLLQEFNLSVVITGHPIGLVRGFGSHSDILYPVHIKNLTPDCYKEMCRKYLNSARTENSLYYDTYRPFEEELVTWLSEKFGGLALTPRLYNNSCFYILQKAVDEGTERIDEASGKEYLTDKYIELFGALKPDDKLFLKAVYEAGGTFDEDNRELIERITDDRFASITQVIFKAIAIEEQQGLLTRQISPDGNLQFQATGQELEKFKEYIMNYLPE